MKAIRILAVGIGAALGAAAPAFAAQPAPYFPPQQQPQVAKASKLDKSEQIDALRRKDRAIQQLIDDLESGRRVDPRAIDRALE